MPKPAAKTSGASQRDRVVMGTLLGNAGFPALLRPCRVVAERNSNIALIRGSQSAGILDFGRRSPLSAAACGERRKFGDGSRQRGSGVHVTETRCTGGDGIRALVDPGGV